MRKNYIPHGTLVERKIQSKNDAILEELSNRYILWSHKCNELNSENEIELKEKVKILNEYKNFVDKLTNEDKYFNPQEKMSSSVMEEFLFYLLKDIPSIQASVSEGLIYMGSANAYTDLSFAPKNIKDFLTYPNVFINYKNQDFTISKLIKCTFECNGNKDYREIIVPTIAIECKTFIPSTQLGQSIYEAQLLKQGNPYSLYIIVAEQNALSDDVNLKNIPIDEIFILRKQKRNSMKNKVSDKKPIDYKVMQDLYYFVRDYLNKEWFNNEKATERGRLIKI